MNAPNKPPAFYVVRQDANGETVSAVPCADLSAVHAAVVDFGMKRVLRPGDRLFIDFREDPSDDEG